MREKTITIKKKQTYISREIWRTTSRTDVSADADLYADVESFRNTVTK